MCTSTPKAPTPPPMLPEAPVAPTTTSQQGDTDQRRRRSGVNSTILTGPRGVQDSGNVSAGKTLLGN